MLVNATQIDEREHRLATHINATQHTIAECPYPDIQDTKAYTLGAIRGMLQGMAGLGEFSEASLFSPEVTEAIKGLLATIE